MNMKTVLVTGCAGFIGSNLVDRLLADGFRVAGIDNFDNYYDIKQKWRNLEEAKKSRSFKLYELELLDLDKISNVYKFENPDHVIHLAARPGVRPSLKDPLFYAKNNIEGTVNLLKLSVDFKVNQFIFASSSSVYGQFKRLPFYENDPINSIISPYGASKRSGEFFVEAFYRSFGLRSIIFRFFTVYGRRGRPDMAPALFSKAILKGKKIRRYGKGDSFRDYTYIDDIVDAILLGFECELDFGIINLGNSKPIKLNDFIHKLEMISGKKAKIESYPDQRGDIEKTWAAIVKAKEALGWQPKNNIDQGLAKYLEWQKKNL